MSQTSAEGDDDAGLEEEVEFLDAQACDSTEVLARIERLAAEFASAVSQGLDFPISLWRRDSKNVLWDGEGKMRLGSQVTVKCMFGRQGAGLRRYTLLWKIMAFVQKLLQERKQCTQREAYYCLVTYFTNQAEFNESLLEVSSLIGCSRFSLGICAASSGSIAGSVLWIEGQNEPIDCTQAGSTGKRIPGDVSEVSFTSLGARYIIVVEKDAVFMYLCEHRLWERLPCILVTGCGYPPLSVRAIVKQLSSTLNIPVLGLFDYNPHGIRILLTYKFGSARMGAESHNFATPSIQWLGLHHADIFGAVQDSAAGSAASVLISQHPQTLSIPQSSLQQWTTSDDRVFRSLCLMPIFKVNAAYRNELRLIAGERIKAEIEALNSDEWGRVAKLVVSKILRHQYF